MKANLLLLLAVSSCGIGDAINTERNATRPPAACPAGVRAPEAPKAPRTVESIAQYANGLASAHRRTEAARAECARRLRALNEWANR